VGGGDWYGGGVAENTVPVIKIISNILEY